MKITNRGAVIGIVLAGLLGVGGTAAFVATTDTGRPAGHAQPTPSPGAEPVDSDLTEFAFEMSWLETSAADRADICSMVDILGTEFVVDLMQEEAAGDPDLEGVDWERVGTLYGEKCDQEGI